MEMMPYPPEHLRLCTLKTQLQLPIGNLLDSWGLGKDYSDYGKATSITGRTNFCFFWGGMIWIKPKSKCIITWVGNFRRCFAYLDLSWGNDSWLRWSEKKLQRLQRAPLVPGPRPRHVFSASLERDAVFVLPWLHGYSMVQCLFFAIPSGKLT